MQITNKFNLPQPLMAAIENDEYSRGSADISATSLWKAPRIVALEEANADKIVIDANDTGLSFFGRAMHEYLAKRTVDATVENRLYMKREGWVVSGAIDRATLMLGGMTVMTTLLTRTMTASINGLRGEMNGRFDGLRG